MNLKNIFIAFCLLVLVLLCISNASATPDDVICELNSSYEIGYDSLEIQNDTNSDLEYQNDDYTIDKSESDDDNKSAASDNTSQSLTDENGANDTKLLSFDDLQQMIRDAQPGSVLRLTNSFKYSGPMGGEGIIISKSLTIMGKNNCSIDGIGKSRIFKIGADCRVTIAGVIFKNGYCRGTVSKSQDGAAINVLKGSSLIVRNCVFMNNKVYNANGAAIYGNENTMIKVMNSKFIGNDAIRSSNVAFNKFKRGIGSAIYVNLGSILRTDNSIYQNNTAYASTIYVASYINSRYLQSTAMINNCRFYYNTAKIHSIFYLDKFSKGSVGATVFKGNQVYDAGSILKVDASKSFVVQNSKFVKNTAVSGILYLGEFKDSKLGYGISHVKVSTCSFYYNRAYCGGSIFSQSGNLNVISTFFLGNAATKNGGAIATNNKGALKLYNCNFRSNRAMNGGAIYSFVKGARATKCYFINNSASRAGPDIYGTVTTIPS